MTRFMPTRNIKTYLYRTGPLLANPMPGAVPTEFNELVDNVVIPYAYPVPANPTPAYVVPESVISVLATYDELILNLQPYLSPGGLVTNQTTEQYRMILAANRPFWLVIQTDSYGQTAYNTAADAKRIAAGVMDSYAADILNYHLQGNFLGFAILNPNLNVKFGDASVITREIQSYLIQKSHELATACCIVTTRPHDQLTILGPTIAANTNSNKPLVYPILGQNEQSVNDLLIATYVNVFTTYPNMSDILAQVAAFSTGYGLDRYTPLAIDYGYSFPINPALFQPDAQSGMSEITGGSFSKIQKIATFLAALGVTNICMSSQAPDALVPLPPDWLPDDTLVNTSRKLSYAWSSAGTLTVKYPDSDGNTVTRTFNSTYTETTPEPT